MLWYTKVGFSGHLRADLAEPLRRQFSRVEPPTHSRSRDDEYLDVRVERLWELLILWLVSE